MRNLLFFLVPFLLLSCGDRELSDDLKKQMVDENQIHDCLAYIANMDYDIESRGERFESLIYTNDLEECKSVLWYLEDTLTVVRENTRNLKTNEQHEISFYFKQGQLYLVQDITNFSTEDGEMSSDEYILLYENGVAFRAWSNHLQDGVFDPYKYEAADLKIYKPNRAMDMFNHEKEFILHFEDFLESQGDTYLLVNTGQKENFIAAIKIDSMDDFLQTLYADKSKFKNVALDLSHQAVNQGGWTFHYYVSGGFLR